MEIAKASKPGRSFTPHGELKLPKQRGIKTLLFVVVAVEAPLLVDTEKSKTDEGEENWSTSFSIQRTAEGPALRAGARAPTSAGDAEMRSAVCIFARRWTRVRAARGGEREERKEKSLCFFRNYEKRPRPFRLLDTFRYLFFSRRNLSCFSPFLAPPLPQATMAQVSLTRSAMLTRPAARTVRIGSARRGQRAWRAGRKQRVFSLMARAKLRVLFFLVDQRRGD